MSSSGTAESSEAAARVLLEWFGAPGGPRHPLYAALRAERLVFDPSDAADLEELRLDAARIARGMDSPQCPPPMFWSGIPMPPPVGVGDCDPYLVISIGGTKTEFALLRMERGRVIGFDLAGGREVSTPGEVARVKDATRMPTPVHGPDTPTGFDMIRQIVGHIARHLEPRLAELRRRCRGALLSWGFAHRAVRRTPELVGGLIGIATTMTKDQSPFTPHLWGRDIGALFATELEACLGWSPAFAVANDTVMALHYFLRPEWRPLHHRIGLFINGTGTNYAMAEPYAVRPQGYLSAPGEEYQPERLRAGRVLGPGETELPFFVNYEAGSIELIATRTRFDLEVDYQIERNALAGGKAFPQMLRVLTRELFPPELYAKLRDGWARAQGLAGDAPARAPDPGAPLVGALSAGDGSPASTGALIGGAALTADEASGLRLLARAIVARSALHGALVLAAITLRNGYGLGGDGKADLLAMEGSVWKIPGYADLVRAWWERLADRGELRVRFASEPSFNASLPGPLYLMAFHGG
jgi:hypothetical protein